MIFGGLATSNSVPFCLHYIQAFRLCQDEKWGCVSHSWSSPSGTTPQSANAASCLRKILLNRTVPRTVRPFQGSHERCRLQHTLQKSDASPERARGTAKRWRGAPPAPASPHSTTYPHTAKPPGITPQGPCILRGIFLNQIRGRLSGEVTRCDGSSTLGNGVAVSLARNHSGGQATRANRRVKLVQVEVVTANC